MWQGGPSGLGEWHVACGYGAVVDGSEDRAAGQGLVGHLMGPRREGNLGLAGTSGDPGAGEGDPGPH